MQVFYNILLVISLIVAVIFSTLIFITGKGDAMSGGSGVRTSFKGKASFEDQISRVTLYLGIGFMVLMISLDTIASFLQRTGPHT